MNALKILPIFVLSILLFTACKKNKFESTGTLVLNFKNGIPTCYRVYTESSYSAGFPLYASPSGPLDGLNVKHNGNTLTFEGLNYGTYV
jgi:hypothetical protein